MVIYAITTFEKVDKSGQFPDYGDTRTVGYYNEHSLAKDVIKKNTCDIFEGMYMYAVLETLPNGLYPTAQNNYHAEYFKWNKTYKCYEAIDASEVEVPGMLATWSMG